VRERAGPGSACTADAVAFVRDSKPEASAMWELRFMEPQSRWVMRVVFRRNFDAFVDSAKRTVNWAMLLWDAIILYGLLLLL
jgi:hypothetical protein